MTPDDIVKEKFGEDCSFVKVCEHDKNKIVVRRGLLEYEVTLHKSPANSLLIKMITNETRTMLLNKICTNNVVIKSVRKERHMIKGIFIHSPTGFMVERKVESKRMDIICRKIEEEALKQERFLNAAKLKYGNKFSFEKSIYIASEKPITITCPIHGYFITTPHSFLHQVKFGCRQCGIETNHGFSRKTFINGCENNIGYIYILECVGNNEKFIKIGVTSKENIKHRFGKRNNLPYKYETILHIGGNPEFIFNLEHKIHKELKKYKYRPEIKFHGVSECFDISIKQEAICFIQKLLLTSQDVN